MIADGTGGGAADGQDPVSSVAEAETAQNELRGLGARGSDSPQPPPPPRQPVSRPQPLDRPLRAGGLGASGWRISTRSLRRRRTRSGPWRSSCSSTRRTRWWSAAPVTSQCKARWRARAGGAGLGWASSSAGPSLPGVRRVAEAFGKSRRPGSENSLDFHLFLTPEWGQTLPCVPPALLLAGPTGLGALTDPRRKVIL